MRKESHLFRLLLALFIGSFIFIGAQGESPNETAAPRPDATTPTVLPTPATSASPSPSVTPAQVVAPAPAAPASPTTLEAPSTTVPVINPPAEPTVPQATPEIPTGATGEEVESFAAGPTGVSEENVAAGENQLANPQKTILINFNNVSAVEFIRFISKTSGRNFIFEEEDLQFQVTIVSEEPTTFANIMAALMQELRIHGMALTEQGNNIIIHKNASVNGISTIFADNIPESDQNKNAEIATRLFRLNTADPEKIAAILKPLVSANAIIEVFRDTNHLIITDIVTNIDEIAVLIKSLDAPNNGLVIGQYVVRSGYVDSLIQLAQMILQPISQDQTLIFVPHRIANSIFIVSTPFIMERTIALLQYLDQNQGTTRIFNLNDLKFDPNAQGGPGAGPERPGQWQLDSNGNWIFSPLQQAGVTPSNQPPQGYWFIDEQGNWRFQSGAAPATPPGRPGLRSPEGNWRLDTKGVWFFQLAPGKSIAPGRLTRPERVTAELPLGHIERTQFYLYKLQNRRGDQVQAALARIGISLEQTTSNRDLVTSIESVQWIESSNSLIFTGTAESLDKIRALLPQIDTPLRQVFIEMLIIETDLDDSLSYGVNWGTQSGGGNTATNQAFLTVGSPLELGMQTAIPPSFPNATPLVTNTVPGFTQGIIGRHLTHGGIQFSTLGALVNAIHDRVDTKIIMSPKILVEDNVTAEIFVGINTQFPTQAVANNNGNILTQNFEFRDVGTDLKVTPQIGDNGIITLTIEEEVSQAVAASNATTGTTGPTTKKSTTKTRVHIPNEYFLVMSGMMQDTLKIHRVQVPCLGGIPFIGAGFSQRDTTDTKRNQMIFIRPRIIETIEEIHDITKHQQDIYEYGNFKQKMWVQETEEALEFFNLPQCEECDEDCCRFNG